MVYFGNDKGSGHGRTPRLEQGQGASLYREGLRGPKGTNAVITREHGIAFMRLETEPKLSFSSFLSCARSLLGKERLDLTPGKTTECLISLLLVLHSDLSGSQNEELQCPLEEAHLRSDRIQVEDRVHWFGFDLALLRNNTAPDLFFCSSSIYRRHSVQHTQ